MAPKEKEYPPIAAAYSSPGSGAYALPTVLGPRTAVNKHCAPQWSMRHPLKTTYNDAPGPAFKPADNQAPTATIKSRAFYQPAQLVTPGSNAYSAKINTNSNYVRAPTYSMGRRTRNRKGDNIPPPNSYSLPTLVGGSNPVSKSAPVSSMSFIKPEHNSHQWDATKGPGPAAYHTGESKTSRRNPEYSLAARFNLPSDKTEKPGPGSYHKHGQVYTSRQKKPSSFTMGVRHSQYVLPLITAADIV